MPKITLDLPNDEIEKLKELVNMGMADIERTLGQFKITGAIEKYRVVKSKIDAIQEQEKRIFPTLSLNDGVMWVNPTKKFASDFGYVTKELDSGIRLGVVVDHNTEGCRSVTNDIANIAEYFNVDHIVYKDSDGTWTYWGSDLDFKNLYAKIEGRGEPVPPPSVDIAIEIAVARYIGK